MRTVLKTLIAFITACILLAPLPSNAQPTKSNLRTQTISKLNNLVYQLHQIEHFIGKTPRTTPDIHLKHITTREIYFAAETLYERANRFCFEITGIYVDKPQPKAPPQTFEEDALTLINQALERTNAAEKALDMPRNMNNQPSRSQQVSKKQIFDKIMLANKLLANLLYQKTTPEDVYAQVSLANEYLRNFAAEAKGTLYQAPYPKPYKKRKRPADVYQALQTALIRISAVAKQLGVRTIGYQDNPPNKTARIEPDNVLDLSKLLVAESQRIAQSDNVKTNIPIRYYGYKTPTQVYEQVEALNKQLDLILKQVHRYQSCLVRKEP